MAGGLPVVPVYDLKIKDSDLVAATHGRSFWILDDVTPLRGLAERRRKSTRLFAPRTAIRTKLHWSAGANVRSRHRLRPGLRHRRQHRDGRTARRHALREHLDVGENPPNGAIVYYWLAEDATGAGDAHLPRCRRAARSSRFASDDKDAAAGAPARHQGGAEPLRLGHEVSRADQARLRPGAAAAQAAGARSRESARPDRRARQLRRRARRRRARRKSAKFTVVKDPRLPTTPADYAAQFALHKELVASLSKLKAGAQSPAPA